MKILIVSQYFWPENFRINDICLGLKSRGHEVSVLTGRPNYPSGKIYNGYSATTKRQEKWHGINIYRSLIFPRKNGKGIFLALNYLSFAIFGSIRGLVIKEKFDVILVFQPSPITSAIPAIIIKKVRKIPVNIWVQDLWPESVKVAGNINNKFVLNSLTKLTSWVYDNCQKILLQSKGFKSFILEQGVSINKIKYVPNTCEEYYEVTNPLPIHKKFFPKGFNFLFAGNLGEAQSLETIVKAAEIVNKTNNQVNWIFAGSGRSKSRLIEEIKERDLESNIHLIGSFEPTEMASLFACTDVLIVSLKKDKIFEITVPSKMQSYMACSKPILGSIDGEGAEIIRDASCGFVAEAEDYKSLAELAIKMIEMDTDDLKGLGVNGLSYFNSEFSRNYVLQVIENQLELSLTEFFHESNT